MPLVLGVTREVKLEGIPNNCFSSVNMSKQN